jgi:hypothetical protein
MKNILMLAGAMMISSFIFAQNDETPDRHRGGRHESMKTVLALDDKQVSSIEEINRKYHERAKQSRNDLDKQREAEISKVLTPEQSRKWSDHKKERSEKFTQMRDQKVKNDLKLSDDQLSKLKSTLSEEQYNKLAFSNQGRREHGAHGKHHSK